MSITTLSATPITIPSFLSDADCDHLISLIDQDNTRSLVIDPLKNTTYLSDYRTSHTTNFSDTDPVVSSLFSKVSVSLGLDLGKGQTLQGQVYSPGQYFKEHQDYFHTLEGMEASGNRTHTCMIYLNDNFDGGETFFKTQNIKIQPKKGTAVLWLDMDGKGNVLPETLHEGMPVKNGKKYIVTSWWRENEWNPTLDYQIAQGKKNRKWYMFIGVICFVIVSVILWKLIMKS